MEKHIPTEEIVKLTTELMVFQSYHGKQSEKEACFDYILQWCQKYGLSCQVHKVGKTLSLYVGPDHGQSPILLLSHYDVVPGAESMFSPLICGDILYGRGSSDDKYAVALTLILYREILASVLAAGGTQADMPLMLGITGDRELGGKEGAYPLLSQIQPQFCVVLDGTDHEKICTCHKGMAQVELTGRGLATHSAQPWAGDNAALKLYNDFKQIENLFLTLFPPEKPDYWHPVLSLDSISTSSALCGMVPNYAVAQLALYFCPGERSSALVSLMLDHISGALRVVRQDSSFQAIDSHWLRRLFEISGCQEGRSAYTSDAGHLAAFGISGALWGCKGDANQHSDGEHLVISSIAPVYTSLKTLCNSSMYRVKHHNELANQN